jgi:hypothetical protein
MTKRFWVILAILAVLFAAMTVQGVRKDDVDIVSKNASNFCFS